MTSALPWVPVSASARSPRGPKGRCAAAMPPASRAPSPGRLPSRYPFQAAKKVDYVPHKQEQLPMPGFLLPTSDARCTYGHNG